MSRLMICLCLTLLVFSAPLMAADSDTEQEYLNADTAEPGWEPLKIELPKAMFIGTPKDISTPNLEKVTGKKRKPFLAPPGTTNLALDKSVSSSDTEPLYGDVELITDGDIEGTDGSFVELAAGPQWVQIDLEEVCTLHAIVFWHYHAEARIYYDVVIKTAEDPDFIMGVKTLFNNDHDNSAGLGVGKDKEYIDTNEGKLIDANGVKARYLRLYSAGNTSCDTSHYIEVKVYGKKGD